MENMNMVKKQLSNNVIKSVQLLRSRLEDNKIPIDSMIVFGSEAKGSAHAGSDIDVCVVSPSFGQDEMADIQMLFKQARHVDSRLEPYPMNPANLTATYNPIVNEIVTWGVLV